MFKLAGILCILAGCVGWGAGKIGEEKNRIRHLKELIRIIKRIQDEICYGKHTMPEICLTLSECCDMPYRVYFKQIYEQMGQERGVCLDRVWEEQAIQWLKGIPLSDEEKSILKDLPRNLGAKEEKRQAESIGQSIDYLVRRCRQAEDNYDNKSRMILSVSVLTGVFLTILLL